MANRETKQKVMALGNRLSSRMDRSAAFRQAWKIVRNGGIELSVKGETYGLRQEAVKRLANYKSEQVWAFRVPEPENSADKKAAAVYVGVQYGKGLFCMGYLPREYAPARAAFRTAGIRVLDGDIRGARVALAV
jgi:hypothetical protein